MSRLFFSENKKRRKKIKILCAADVINAVRVKSKGRTNKIGTTNEPARDKTYKKTCITSKDSDQPVHPLSMATVLVYPSLDSLGAVDDTCYQQRLWSVCADAQADLSLRWSHKSYCRLYHALVHFISAVRTSWGPKLWAKNVMQGNLDHNTVPTAYEFSKYPSNLIRHSLIRAVAVHVQYY